jgi:CubicO group peptidase (beta-lactamase class C family)
MREQDAQANGAGAKWRAVCECVVGHMERLKVPGVAVGVLCDGQEHIAGFGVTSVEHPLPITEDTLFQIGSITKTFTATAIMRLVEMGKIDLEAPIRTYLPDLRLADETVAAHVTMRHLLTHTAGWEGDYFNDFGLGDDALAKMVAKMADLPQLTPLGAVWSYNNAGFYLAGRVIEVVTGTAYETALKELVLDPLALERSFFFAHDVITHRFAVGHQTVDERTRVARPWAIGRAAHPAGGIVCTIGDLLRYARFHMGDGTAAGGTRLLQPETLRLMQTPLLPTTGLSMIGLSWMLMSVDGVTLAGHSGGTNGQIAEFRMAPARSFAFACCANWEDGGLLSQEVLHVAVKEYLGLSWPQATPQVVPDEQLLPYVGRYATSMTQLDLNPEDGGLVLHLTPKGGFPTPETPPPPAPPPGRFVFYAEDRIIGVDGVFKDMRGEFLRNADGSIAWLRLGSRIHGRVG